MKQYFPWTDEPDADYFVYDNRYCLIKRGPLGALNGYAAVTPSSPLYGLHYDSLMEIEEIDVHGGLTFSGNKVLTYGGPRLWWFGFDCAHAGDLVPSMQYTMETGIYRDINYVRKETINLAYQLTVIEKRLS